MVAHHGILPPTTGCRKPHPELDGAPLRVVRHANLSADRSTLSWASDALPGAPPFTARLLGQLGSSPFAF